MTATRHDVKTWLEALAPPMAPDCDLHDSTPVTVPRGADAGAIAYKRTTALQLAIDAAGGLEELDDLSSREEYGGVVDLLKELDLK